MSKERALWTGLFFIIVAISLYCLYGCGTQEAASFSSETVVLYDGPPYGDIQTIYGQVKACVGSNREDEPSVRLVDRTFSCGGILAGGCYDQENDIITMVADGTYGEGNNLQASKGALMAHETVHRFKGAVENDPCGAIRIDNFDWRRGL